MKQWILIVSVVSLTFGCGKETETTPAKLKGSTAPVQTQQQPNVVEPTSSFDPSNPVGPLSKEQELLRGMWTTECNQSHENGIFYRNSLRIVGAVYRAENIYFANEADCIKNIKPQFSALFHGKMSIGNALADNENIREVDFMVEKKWVVVMDQDSLSLVQGMYQDSSISYNLATEVSLDRGVRFLPDTALKSVYSVAEKEVKIANKDPMKVLFLTVALNDCPSEEVRTDFQALFSTNTVVYTKK